MFRDPSFQKPEFRASARLQATSWRALLDRACLPNARSTFREALKLTRRCRMSRDDRARMCGEPHCATKAAGRSTATLNRMWVVAVHVAQNSVLAHRGLDCGASRYGPIRTSPVPGRASIRRSASTIGRPTPRRPGLPDQRAPLRLNRVSAATTPAGSCASGFGRSSSTRARRRSTVFLWV